MERLERLVSQLRFKERLKSVRDDRHGNRGQAAQNTHKYDFICFQSLAFREVQGQNGDYWNYLCVHGLDSIGLPSDIRV